MPALLGHFGIPLLLVTGDRTTVEGVRALMPWVQGVVVKESIGTFAAASMTPEAARARHPRRGAQAAVERASASAAVSLRSADRTRRRSGEDRTSRSRRDDPGLPRAPGARSVRFVHDDFPTIFKAFVATWRLGGQA